MARPSFRHALGESLGSLAVRISGSIGSLAVRISFFVFAATLTSALAVGATSTYAVRAFLRSRLEERIPEAAAELRDRLHLWYAQRQVDVQVFARSELLASGLAALARGPADARPRARADLEQYLGYVLAESPQYAALFALDGQGRLLVHAGLEPGLGEGERAALARVEDAAVSGLLASSAGVAQVASAAVRTRGGGASSLHALIAPGELAHQLDPGGRPHRAFLVDGSGELVASPEPSEAPAGGLPEALRAAKRGELRDYLTPDGLRVVGSALPLGRFGWTLVVEASYEAAFAPIASLLWRTASIHLAIVLVLAGAAFAITTSLVRPLRTLSEAARRLGSGETEIPLPVVDRSDEVGVLARSFAEMVRGVRDAHATLQQLAITDGLTKLHNHRFFHDQLSREIRRCERNGSSLALILLDIDDFKALNDRFGHASGDAVLEQTALLLARSTRDQDLVARYGGEEFAILAPDTDRNGAILLAEKVRLAIGTHAFHSAEGHATPSITVSAGVAVYRGDREGVFAAADRALYAAKHEGKDCVVAEPEA